jgi:hypothetical protein
MGDDSNSEASRSLGSDSPRSDDSNSEASRSLGSDSPRSDDYDSEDSGSLDSDYHMSNDYKNEASVTLGSDSPRSHHSNSEASRSDEDDFLKEVGNTLDLTQDTLLQGQADSESEGQFLDDNGSGGVYATKEDLYRDIQGVLQFISKMQDEDEAEAKSAAAAVQPSDNPVDLQRQIDELTKKNNQKRAKLAEKYALKLRKDERQLDESIPNNIQNDDEEMEPMEEIEEQLSKLSRYRLLHNGLGPKKSLRQGGLTFEPIRIHELIEMQQRGLIPQNKARLKIKDLMNRTMTAPGRDMLKQIRTIICDLLKEHDLNEWKSLISPSCEKKAPRNSVFKLDFKRWRELDKNLDELSTNIQKVQDYENLLQETSSDFICTFENERVSPAFVHNKLMNGDNYLWMMHTTENKQRVTLGFAVASRHFAQVGGRYCSIFHLEAICGQSFGYAMFSRVLKHAMTKTLTVDDQVVYQYDYFELEAINLKLDTTYTAWVEKILDRPEKKPNEAPKFLRGLADVSIEEYNKNNRNKDLYPRYLDLKSAREHVGLL